MRKRIAIMMMTLLCFVCVCSQAETLRKGCHGEDVKRLQTILSEMGHLYGRPDGGYGSYTAAAVREAQRARSFTVTGEADDEFMEYLTVLSEEGESAAAEYRASCLEFSEGDKSPMVKVVQRKLVAAGYLESVTGTYDRDTAIAVKTYALATDTPQEKVYTVLIHEMAPLKRGDKGIDVAQLQSFLVEQGYTYGMADGYYGARTYKAVRKAQKKLGLTVNGIADEAFLKAIGFTY